MSGALLEQDLRAPDLIGPVEAWRAWRVVRRGGRHMLGSVIKQSLWQPGRPLVARCFHARSPLDWLLRRPVHDAPAAECACGIYGADLERAANYFRDAGPAFARVIGSVSLWGCVVECEQGFRASHAYPARLYVPADAGRKRDDAARIAADLCDYGVKVELLESRASDMLAQLAEEQTAG